MCWSNMDGRTIQTLRAIITGNMGKIMPVTLLASLVVLGAFLLSSTAFAETYLYVDTSGKLQPVIAENPDQAIAIAPNRTTHSGVMLSSVEVPEGLGGMGAFVLSATANTYLYVDASGELRAVIAENPDQAIAIAPDRTMHSGVMTAE